MSSEFGDGFAAENAVDGDLTTEWSSAGDGDEAFITIDLGRSNQITAIEFLTRSMTDAHCRGSRRARAPADVPRHSCGRPTRMREVDFDDSVCRHGVGFV